MTGTLVNAAAIVVGSLIGLLIKNGIPKHIENALLTADGLVIMVTGLNGVIAVMFSVDSAGKLTQTGGLLLLVSLVAGVVIGELCKIDQHIDGLGLAVEKKFKANGFQAGFVSASVLFCIGAMAIIGSMNDGLKGDSSILLVKSGLDGVTALILASSLGKGVVFSAIPVFLYQGAIALLSGLLKPVLTDTLLNSICMVGYVIVLAIGINFVFKTKIKVANMLPALFIPAIYYAVASLF